MTLTFDLKNQYASGACVPNGAVYILSTRFSYSVILLTFTTDFEGQKRAPLNMRDVCTKFDCDAIRDRLKLKILFDVQKCNNLFSNICRETFENVLKVLKNTSRTLHNDGREWNARDLMKLFCNKSFNTVC